MRISMWYCLFAFLVACGNGQIRVYESVTPDTQEQTEKSSGHTERPRSKLSIRKRFGPRDIRATKCASRTKTSGAVVWVDEDGGDAQESEITRAGQGGVAVHLYGSRLQSLPIAKPDGPSPTGGFETGQSIASHAFQITSARNL